MINQYLLLLTLVMFFSLKSCNQAQQLQQQPSSDKETISTTTVANTTQTAADLAFPKSIEKIEKNTTTWPEDLSPQASHVLRAEG